MPPDPQPPAVLPPDPTVSGWHWIKGQHSIPFVMYWQPGTVGEWLDGDGTSYTPKELTGSQHVYIEPVQPPRTHAEPDETRAIAGRLYDKVLELQAEVAALREAQTRAAGEIERLRAIIASEVSWYEEEHQRGNLTPEGQSARSVWRQMQTEMTMRQNWTPTD